MAASLISIPREKSTGWMNFLGKTESLAFELTLILSVCALGSPNARKKVVGLGSATRMENSQRL